MSGNLSLDLIALEANRNIPARNYWRDRLAGFEWERYFDRLPGIEAADDDHYALYSENIPSPAFDRLNGLAVTDKARHIVLMTTLSILIRQCSSSADVGLITPGYGQPPAGAINTVIPVRINNFTGKSFSGLLMSVKEELMLAFKYANYPLDKILNTKAEKLTTLPVIGMMVEDLQPADAFDHFLPDMVFSFGIQSSGTLHIRYRSSVYPKECLPLIARLYFNLLDTLIGNKEEIIDELETIPQQDKNRILHEFNDTTAFYPKQDTILSLFERQAEQTPDNWAVMGDTTNFTYRDLRMESARITSWLEEQKGVNEGDLVGIMLQRDEWLLPVILGILGTGAAYVPIDPAYPEERITSILEDSRLKLLLTRHKSLEIPAGVEIVDLDNARGEIARQEPRLPGREINSSNIAYVIYTSGSTGKPKGVMIEHHSVVNRIAWMQKMYPLEEKDVLLQKTPIVFDVSVWELFWWSFTGAALCLLKPGGEKDPAEMIRTIRDYKVTTLHFVPSMLAPFLKVVDMGDSYSGLKSLRRVFASGEALDGELVHQFGRSLYRHNGTRLINLYGPTEATVDVSYYECTFDQEVRSVPIGRPIDNIRLYVMDDHEQLSPVGCVGELYIAGVGLARGYLNNEKLTNERFVQSRSVKGERMYRTGDLARWRQDGNLDFLGRSDDQVKIRGFRIEPGEVKARLLEKEEISEAVVIAKGKGGGKFLVAYYIAEKELEATALKEFLEARLPEYAIPTHFILLSRLPLTANGKLDRKSLPDPEITAGSRYTAPSNEVEEKLVAIWAEVLQLDTAVIGTSRTFFEMGGNSLKLIEVNERINAFFSWGITVPDLFQYPTISALTNFITKGPAAQNELERETKEEVSGMQDALGMLQDL